MYQRKQIVEDIRGNLSESSGQEQNTFTKFFQEKLESKNPWDQVVVLSKVSNTL